MQAKRSVIEVEKGKERLTFPGPGGYTIQWSPGTMHIPLESAPSGHLVIPLESLDKAKPHRGGLPADPNVFHATDPFPTSSSSSGVTDAVSETQPPATGSASSSSHA